MLVHVPRPADIGGGRMRRIESTGQPSEKFPSARPRHAAQRCGRTKAPVRVPRPAVHGGAVQHGPAAYAGAPDAADLTQETFLRAYRTFENFTPGTNCKAWLFTILYSIFVNQYRQAKQRPRVESLEALGERFHQFAQAPDPASDITTVEGWGWRWSPEVERALRQLPEDFRAPLLLVDVEELAYEEAASVLGCAVGTVGARLFRGRKLLFAMLQAYAHAAGYGKGTSLDR